MVKDMFTNGIQGSDDQHIEDILLLAKGQHKFTPELGANVKRHIKSRQNTTNVTQIIQENLVYDGIRYPRIEMQNDIINIQATYENA